MSTIVFEPSACFRQALARALAHVEHEGLLASVANEGSYNATVDGVTLSVALLPGEGPAVIKTARHSGASDSWVRAAFEGFCGLIEGLPLQEASEHGAIQLIERLRDPEQPVSVKGILTPRNAGSIFSILERVMREIYVEHVAASGRKPGPNHWNPRLPSEWARKRAQEQIELLQPIVTSQLRDEGLGPEEARVTGIERGLRATILFGPGVSPQRKPALLMRIERRMRRETGGRLEVFAEEMHDQNAIRRL